jgi:hypothetical protein
MSAVMRLVARQEPGANCANRGKTDAYPSIEFTSNGMWTKAVGPLDQLIDEGLCTRAHLPIGRRRIRTEWIVEGPLEGWMVRLHGAGRAELLVWHRDHRARAADVRGARQALEGLPTSATAWRERVAAGLAFARAASQVTPARCGGYRLSDADQQRFEAIMQQRAALMARAEMIIMNATPVFDVAERASIVAELEARASPRTMPPLPPVPLQMLHPKT